MNNEVKIVAVSFIRTIAHTLPLSLKLQSRLNFSLMLVNYM